MMSAIGSFALRFDLRSTCACRQSDVRVCRGEAARVLGCDGFQCMYYVLQHRSAGAVESLEVWGFETMMIDNRQLGGRGQRTGFRRRAEAGTG
jgi:hypothetical protein